jgi:hypothetical protein
MERIRIARAWSAVVSVALAACASGGSDDTVGGVVAGDGADAATCSPEAGAIAVRQDPDCVRCLGDRCDAEMLDAYGGDWAQGDFGGGQCGQYLVCASRCECPDAAASGCLAKCQPLLTQACTESLAAAAACQHQGCANACGTDDAGVDASADASDSPD